MEINSTSVRGKKITFKIKSFRDNDGDLCLNISIITGLSLKSFVTNSKGYLILLNSIYFTYRFTSDNMF